MPGLQFATRPEKVKEVPVRYEILTLLYVVVGALSCAHTTSDPLSQGRLRDMKLDIFIGQSNDPTAADPFVIDVTIRNQSERTLEFKDPSRTFDQYFVLTHKQTRKALSLHMGPAFHHVVRRDGMSVYRNPDSNVPVISLKPTDQHSFTANLVERFPNYFGNGPDALPSGTYTIQFVMEFPRDETGVEPGPFTSNLVEIEKPER